eukprot:TRINITY_DN7115_c1_g2_i1.p1 TRINITY_DN7115_c1_g2~~TRINITY_DN7115_c1_g2_i1.p1  ORF type:complete len:109 (-),score=2.87 TRINITY_DN7115_c1_g2_i1:712-1038(-)
MLDVRLVLNGFYLEFESSCFFSSKKNHLRIFEGRWPRHSFPLGGCHISDCFLSLDPLVSASGLGNSRVGSETLLSGLLINSGIYLIQRLVRFGLLFLTWQPFLFSGGL